MKARWLPGSCYVTLLSFSSFIVAQPLACADEEGPDAPRPTAPPATAPTAPAAPPAYGQPPYGQAPYGQQPYGQPGSPPPGAYYPQYQPPPYVAPQTHEELRPMIGLSIGGFITFGGLYTMNLLFGGVVANKGWFYVPGIGPLGYIGELAAQNRCVSSQFSSCGDDPGLRMAYVGLVFDGLVQLAGLTMGIVGLMVKHKVTVPGPRVSLAPFATPGAGGLSAIGSF